VDIPETIGLDRMRPIAVVAQKLIVFPLRLHQLLHSSDPFAGIGYLRFDQAGCQDK
jgi:hypothetical protein